MRVRQRRRNRATGTVVEVVDATDATEPFDPADGGRWATVCVDHGGVAQHPTLALARSWAADPTGWCDDCRHGRPTINERCLGLPAGAGR